MYTHGNDYKVYELKFVSLIGMVEHPEYREWIADMRSQGHTSEIQNVTELYFDTDAQRFPEIKEWLRNAPPEHLYFPSA